MTKKLKQRLRRITLATADIILDYCLSVSPFALVAYGKKICFSFDITISSQHTTLVSNVQLLNVLYDLYMMLSSKLR